MVMMMMMIVAWRQDDRWAGMERQQGELESEKLGSSDLNIMLVII